MKVQFKLGALLLMSLAFGLAMAQEPAEGSEQEKRFIPRQKIIAECDIALDGATFRQDPMSSAFIIEGYLYPHGRLNDDGVNETGGPQYPDEVIGRWTCMGWGLVPRPDTDTLPAGITTQTFEFGNDNAGQNMMTTQGTELGVFVLTNTRVITGGTGEFVNVNGEQKVVYININPTGALNMRVQFVKNFFIPLKK